MRSTYTPVKSRLTTKPTRIDFGARLPVRRSIPDYRMARYGIPSVPSATPKHLRL